MRTQAEEAYIRPGASVERRLAGGEAHAYRVNVSAGQYVKVVVVQKGIDVALKLSGPDGQKLSEVDNTGRSEIIFAVAVTSGEYVVEVRTAEKEAAAGAYEIRVEELRPATDRDRVAVAAQSLFEDGNRLRDQRTAESRRAAIRKYEEALALWREVGEKAGEGYTLNELGVIHSNLGEPRAALEFYSQSLPVWRALGDQVNEATTLTNMGTAYWRLSQWQEALDCHAQALRLARAADAPLIEGVALRNTGAVYWSLGQPQEALKYYAPALLIAQRLGDRQRQAITLNNIGTAYQQLGELQRAAEYLTRALLLRRALGSREGEGAPLTNLGRLYVTLGDLQRASDYFQRALELRKASGDRQGEATDLEGLSVVHLRRGSLGPAREYAEQALAQSRAVGDRQLEAYVLAILGTIYQLLGEPTKSLESFEQSLSLRQAVGDRYGESYALSGVGDSYLRSGEQAKAADYYRRSLKLSRDIGDRMGEAVALYGSARANSRAGETAAARAQIESALAIIESTRAEVPGYDLRSLFLASFQDYYTFSVGLLMRMHHDSPSAGYAAAALQASERGRARGLLELLNEAHVDIRSGVDAALLERERSLRQQLNLKTVSLARLQSGKHIEEQAAAAKKELESLLDEYRETEVRIREKSPRYAALTQPRPLSAAEIMRLLDDDTLLVEYTLGEERSYLWAVTPSSVTSFELPKRAEIEAQARHVYDLFTARNRVISFETADKRRARVAEADAEFPRAAGALSRMLLGPVAGRMRGRRLLVVGDGALQYLPFGALPLPDSEGRTKPRAVYIPLIAEHEVVSLPSASTLAVLREELAGRKPAPKSVAVLADPVFDGSDERVRAHKSNASAPRRRDARTDGAAAGDSLVRALREMGGSDEEPPLPLPRLPFTRHEAEAITALAPAGQSAKSLDFDASRAAATDPRLSQYRYVHFATHVVLNTRHPELSGVVLSLTDPEGKEQDGFLLSHEVYNLNLPAEIVVLSGCRTGLGAEVRGEGLVGLTRGFMYAGAERVLVSLWDVNDRSTAELMARFYEEMLGGRRQRPAAALRRAQLAMWKSARWRAPYYWAAFVLHGEYR